MALFAKFGRVSSLVKPVVLHALYMYKELTDNHSASSNLHEAKINERIKCLLDSEDTNVAVDLRHLHWKKGEYDVFWKVRSARIQSFKRRVPKCLIVLTAPISSKPRPFSMKFCANKHTS